MTLRDCERFSASQIQVGEFGFLCASGAVGSSSLCTALAASRPDVLRHNGADGGSRGTAMRAARKRRFFALARRQDRTTLSCKSTALIIATS